MFSLIGRYFFCLATYFPYLCVLGLSFLAYGELELAVSFICIFCIFPFFATILTIQEVSHYAKVSLNLDKKTHYEIYQPDLFSHFVIYFSILGNITVFNSMVALVITMFVFFIWAFILSIQSNFLINSILFYFLGYHVFKITTETHTYYLISKSNPIINQAVIPISKLIYFNP